jgi:hypothetical protein
MKKFAVVAIAVLMSAGVAGAASAKMMHKPMHVPMHHAMHMRMHAPVCAEGMVKAACLCKGGTAKAMCKGGQWCHSFAGVCTM